MGKMTGRSLSAAIILAAACALGLPHAEAGEKSYIVLGSTTSTENSGLFLYILPLFEEKTGIRVRVVARGTGQALQMGRAGDVDLLLVHDREAELDFIRDGYGVERREIMYNDFVIVGPEHDPAGIRGLTNGVEALGKIAAAAATFISRGDDSGTHRAERRIWNETGVDLEAASGRWYLEAGAGMGATLNVATGKRAYTLTDRGTWLSFRNPGDLEILVEGDPTLFNPYGVILVNPERHPHVKAKEALAFIHWITSPEGQAAIASFRVKGEALFFPSYRSGEAASCPPLNQ